jgi:GNAT superfamily N-acetyltransferase
MRLPDGYSDVPPGKIAAVVTHLEMTAPARSRPATAEPGVTVRAVRSPDVAWYRNLYARIGADDWLWFSRLKLTADALQAKIQHPRVEIFTLAVEGRDEGLLELSFETEGECELVFFGVTRPLIGKGAGRLLMNTAIARAWSQPIRRFSVHTCTLDHPGALAFYMRSGFRPFRRQIEIADDPRLSGLLPETAAPHVPIIR